MQVAASIHRLSSLTIVFGQVTAYGVHGLGSLVGGITRIRVNNAQLDQAAVDALASLTQLNSLQLLFKEVQGKPELKASSVPHIDSQYKRTVQTVMKIKVVGERGREGLNGSGVGWVLSMMLDDTCTHACLLAHHACVCMTHNQCSV